MLPQLACRLDVRIARDSRLPSWVTPPSGRAYDRRPIETRRSRADVERTAGPLERATSVVVCPGGDLPVLAPRGDRPTDVYVARGDCVYGKTLLGGP